MLTHERLLERVWKERGDGSTRPMHTMVSKLRRKLCDDAGNPTYIFTEPRVGFLMPKGETQGGTARDSLRAERAYLNMRRMR